MPVVPVSVPVSESVSMSVSSAVAEPAPVERPVTVPGAPDGVHTYVVRVWLPDRPGALGQVASRIGAVRGDVVGIDILERGGGRAIDELTVSLPEGDLVELLVAEIIQVDGVAVEDVRRVDSDRPDSEVIALEIAARLVESPSRDRHGVFQAELLAAFDARWVVILDEVDTSSDPTEAVVGAHGSVPDLGWLRAFLAGSRHLSHAEQAAGAPGDLAWTRLGDSSSIVVVGRVERPFHARERRQIDLLGRIAAALIAQPSRSH